MASKVFFVKTGAEDAVEVISDKLERLLHKSGILSVINKEDFTPIKLHFGDTGNTGHIRWQWVRKAAEVVKSFTPNSYLTDTNVIYKASNRTNSVEHLKIASLHGFDLANIGIPVIISDGLRGRNFIEVPVNGRHFDSVKVASDIADSDSMLAMTHITGHIMTGVGGALKNVGMGCACRRGKYEMHCGAVPEISPSHCVACGECVQICPAGALSLKDEVISIKEDKCLGCGECAVVCRTKAIEIKWSETLENLQEKMVEYAKGVIDSLKSRVAYLNFLIRITKDCDCLAKDDPRIVDDIGILASLDPVAIDCASIALVKNAGKKDVFKSGYPSADWSIQLKYAEELGLGSTKYIIEEVL